MSEDTPDSTVSNGRASLTQVYALVDQTRTELGGRIDDLAARVNTLVVSHENRLTILEQKAVTQDAHLVSVDNKLTLYGRELGALKDQQRDDEAAQRALSDAQSRRLATRRWLISTAISIAFILAAVLPFVIR
jgi:hypothetical protein